MKHFVIFFNLLFALSAAATIRTPEQALQMANAHNAQRRMSDQSHPMRLLTTIRQTNDLPAIYVLQRDADQGYMLISAQTETQAVIAYCDQGRFDTLQMPDNMRFWLDRYTRQIEAITRGEGQPLMRTASYPVVTPLIGSKWNQNSPFNDACPMWGGVRTKAGCTATATAQIMFFHRHPTKGVGSHSYTWNTQTLSANFGATTYDWNNIMATYPASATVVQEAAVATLVNHVGISCDMYYGASSSAASATKAMQALMTYFDYDPSLEVLKMDYLGEAAILERLSTEMTNQRPVLISAYTTSSTGHSFVVEGMDADGLLYINWGWGGLSDGYYALSLMQPAHTGIGGASSGEGYTESIEAYVGIQPNRHGKGIPSVGTVSATLLTDQQISKQTPTGFQFYHLTNLGLCNWSGKLGVDILNSSGTTVTTFLTSQIYTLEASYFFTTDLSLRMDLSSLTNGNYVMAFFYTDTATSGQYPLLLKGQGPFRVPFTISGNQLTIDYSVQSTDIRFAQSTCIYYGSNQWYLDLATTSFWGTSVSGRDMLLRGIVNSGNEYSVIGSYLTCSNASLSIGDQSGAQSLTPNQIELTLSKTYNDDLRMDYYIVADSKTYSGSDTIAVSRQNWWYRSGSSNYVYPSYSLSPAAVFSTSDALNKAQALSATSQSPIPYLIQGVVTHIQIISNGQVELTLAASSSGNYPLTVKKTSWLHQSPVTLATDLQVNDQLILLAYLHKDASGNLSAQGHVYSHNGNTTTLPQIDALDANVRKVLYRNQILILRNGVLYDLHGHRL